jgi:hypothetical protein
MDAQIPGGFRHAVVVLGHEPDGFPFELWRIRLAFLCHQGTPPAGIIPLFSGCPFSLNHNNPSVRSNAFYAIVEARVADTDDQVKLALINLLVQENAYIQQQADLDTDVSEGYGAYFSDVVVAVCLLQDIRSINALIPVIQTGNMVADTLASFGTASLDRVLASSNTTDVMTRFASVMVLNKMIDTGTVTDSTSIAKIRAALNKASVDPDYYTGIAALQGLLKLSHVPLAEGVPARVQLDIKPGSYPNAINPRANGVIPVAILSTSTFDASTIDSSTLRFGPGQARPANRAHVEDVNGDGLPDMVVQFSTPSSQIACSDTASFLVGKTLSGQIIAAADSVRTVGCK